MDKIILKYHLKELKIIRRRYYALVTVIFSLIGFFILGSTFHSKNVINNSYLDSQWYKNFYNALGHRNKQSININKKFLKFISFSIAQKPGSNVQVPAVIDHNTIQSALKEQNEFNPLSATIYGSYVRYWPLINTSIKGADYHFFLTCRIAPYDDCLIWLATKTKKQFVVQPLALYERELNVNENSTIKISNTDIRILLQVKIKYPFRQASKYQKKYEILPGGNVHQIDIE